MLPALLRASSSLARSASNNPIDALLQLGLELVKGSNWWRRGDADPELDHCCTHESAWLVRPTPHRVRTAIVDEARTSPDRLSRDDPGC
jgi:hypothetical protein